MCPGEPIYSWNIKILEIDNCLFPVIRAIFGTLALWGPRKPGFWECFSLGALGSYKYWVPAKLGSWELGNVGS